MANNKNFIAKNGVSTGDGYAMPDVRPSLLLDFANSKSLDPRITFTRGSTATYWDGHTTTKAEENLLTLSQQVDSWGKSTNVTVTANSTTAPDGTTTADTVAGNTATSGTRWVNNGSAHTGNATYSFYAKAGTNDYVQIYWNTGSVFANFDLATGVVGSTSGVTASIVDVGNDWYRCIVSDLSDTYYTAYIQLIDSSTASRAASSTLQTNIYLWGAQKEIRSSATAYTATTTAPIVKYQPTLQTAASGVARFDHDPVTGESKGLLIEEARTNNINQSEAQPFQFSNVYSQPWINNEVIAPDGTQTADTVTGARVDPSSRLERSLSYASGTVLTLSFYQKVIWGNWDSSQPVWAFQNSVGMTATFGDIEDVGNGWYRMHWVITTTAASQTLRLYYNSGVGADDKVALWGYQLETGAFPTSYIATSGSTVTRSLDSAEITGTSFDFFNNQESTLYSEIDMAYSGDNSKGILSVNANISGASGRLVNMYLSSGLQFYYDSYSFGSTVASGNGGNAPPSKVAVGFTTTSYLATSDEQLIGNTSGSYYLDQAVSMKIGGTYNGNTYPLNGHLKKIACYPKQLTSATLQQMTEE